MITGILAFSVLAAPLVLTTPSVVHAQNVKTMTVSPPRVEVKLDPGGTTEGIVKIINDSTVPLTFNVLMQDFIVDNNQGIPNILPPDSLSNKYSASSWIGLETQQVTVPAQTRQELSYYVQVPKDAKPGGHYAAVIYSPINKDEDAKGSGSTVTSQIGTLFYVTVNGPVKEKADVTLFNGPRFSEYGPVNIDTQIRNLGDNHITPKGYISIYNMFGKQSYVKELTARNIFPEKGLNFTNELGKKWMFGRYKAELLGNYGTNNNLPLTASFYFWVIPWKLLVALFGIIVVIVLSGLYVRKNKKGPKQPQPEVSPDAQQP